MIPATHILKILRASRHGADMEEPRKRTPRRLGLSGEQAANYLKTDTPPEEQIIVVVNDDVLAELLSDRDTISEVASGLSAAFGGRAEAAAAVEGALR